MGNQSTAAKDISEQILKDTGEALMTGDFESFSQYFILPQHMETFAGERMITTMEDLWDVFRGVRRYLEENNVTEMFRNCTMAEYRDELSITSTHTSRLLSGNMLVQAPYSAFSLLHYTSDGWKVAETKYAIEDSPEHSSALLGYSNEYI